MRQNLRCLLVFSVPVLIARSFAPADMVRTTGGSAIVGTVEQIADGKLVIVPEFGGKLEIPLEIVTDVTTDKPVSVEMKSGDTLVGPVQGAPEDKKQIVKSQIGDIAVATEQIAYLWPQGTESPKVVAVRKKAEADIEAAKPKWLMTLEGGVTVTEGNTDTITGQGRFDLKRTTTDDLLQYYLAARYGEQNDRRNTNEYRGGTRYEHSFRPKWYWYTGLDLEFDEFEDIDLRATAAAGVGHYWIKKEHHELKTRTGGGYRHESYDTGRTEDDAVVDLGLDYRLDISTWAQYTHSTTYSPDIEDFGNFRLYVDNAIVVPLKNDRLKWKTGTRHEYNSDPQPGLDRLDSTYYTSIVLTLKEWTSR